MPGTSRPEQQLALMAVRLGDGGRLPAPDSRVRPVHLLRGAVRTYAWGSRTAIAEFTGAPSPTPHPEAELWFGGAPGRPGVAADRAPGTARCSTRCAPTRKANSDRWFGTASATRCRSWSRCSPPTSRCRCRRTRAPSRRSRASPARSGWASPSSSPTRNYRDRSHKPELLVALSPFEALAGFRPPPHGRSTLMRALGGGRARPVRQPARRAVRRRRAARAVHDVDHRPQPDLDVLVPAVIDGAINYVRSGEQEFARRGQDRARTRRALSRRRRRAGLDAAQPDHAAARARRSTCPPATCTPTCTASASR